MFKNVASQKLIVFAFDSTTNLPKSGDAANITAYRSLDYGSVTVLTDTSATEMEATNAKGYYLFDLSQAETNGDTNLYSAKSSTANIVVVGSPATVFTFPPNFTTLGINSTGSVSVQSNVKKNQALAGFEFVMTDSTNHNPVTGKTVSGTRSINGAAFAAGTLSAVTEISAGAYSIDIGAGDLNGNAIIMRLTATGCDDLFVTFITDP